MDTDLRETFAAIRPLFARHAAKGIVLHDEPQRFYLGTHEVREGRLSHAARWSGGQEELCLGAPDAGLVYPDSVERIDPALRKRMQGKSCFNFKQSDPALLAELEALIEAAVARSQEDGRLSA